MSACNCGTTFKISFAPIIIEADDIWQGFSATIEFEFLDPADISGDTFSAIIKDSAGDTVDTLTMGERINVDGDTLLQILIETPVTDAAGDYTITVIWTPASTSSPQPFAYGVITVIPVP